MNTQMCRLFSTGLLVAVAGCGAAPPPTLQTGPDAETTVDGLVRVDNAVVPIAYQKPDMDLSPYTAFLIDDVEVAYQKDPGNTRRAAPGAGPTPNFALSPAQMENLKTMFRDAIIENLSKDGGYELTDTPGPNVLEISAGLLDLVVSVPTDRDGTQTQYTRSYGLVTLVLELYDSQSGEILARAGDRRDPTRDTSGSMARVSTTFIQADVRRLFNYWGGLLRERLDALRAM